MRLSSNHCLGTKVCKKLENPDNFQLMNHLETVQDWCFGTASLDSALNWSLLRCHWNLLTDIKKEERKTLKIIIIILRLLITSGMGKQWKFEKPIYLVFIQYLIWNGIGKNFSRLWWLPPMELENCMLRFFLWSWKKRAIPNLTQLDLT